MWRTCELVGCEVEANHRTSAPDSLGELHCDVTAAAAHVKDPVSGLCSTPHDCGELRAAGRGAARKLQETRQAGP